MPKRKIILWTYIVIATTVLATVFTLTRTAPAPVNISFLGYKTNNVGGTLAGFRVINQGHLTLNWSGAYSLQAADKPPVASFASGLMTSLPPNQTQTIWIPKPAGDQSWRVTFDYRPADWRHRLGQWLSRSAWGAKLKAHLRFIPNRSASAESDWVAGK